MDLNLENFVGAEVFLAFYYPESRWRHYFFVLEHFYEGENAFQSSIWAFFMIEFLNWIKYCVLIETASNKCFCLTKDLHS